MSTASLPSRHSKDPPRQTGPSPSKSSKTAVAQANELKLQKVLNQIRDEIRTAVKQSGLSMVRSRFDTSDIVQESMLQIWKQLEDNDVENLEYTQGLLAVIAKGHARKQMRFHTARKRSVGSEETASGPAATRESTPLDNASIREEIGMMINALTFVHPIRQLIVFRRFFDDASYQDIADEICRPKEWVRQQCISAQKELRILMEHDS